MAEGRNGICDRHLEWLAVGLAVDRLEVFLGEQEERSRRVVVSCEVLTSGCDVVPLGSSNVVWIGVNGCEMSKLLKQFKNAQSPSTRVDRCHASSLSSTQPPPIPTILQPSNRCTIAEASA